MVLIKYSPESFKDTFVASSVFDGRTAVTRPHSVRRLPPLAGD